MARAAATFTITELTDWLEGVVFDETKYKEQFLQNIEWFAQLHDHSGDTGDGATITAGEELRIFYYTQALEL